VRCWEGVEVTECDGGRVTNGIKNGKHGGGDTEEGFHDDAEPRNDGDDALE
jgi:hypothetical protein